MENIFSTIFQVLVWCFEHLVFVNILFSLIIIFFERKEPQTVWTWLLVLYFIPIVGFLLYLLIGQNFNKKQMFHMKEIEDEMQYAIVQQEQKLVNREVKLQNKALDRYQNLMLYNLETSKAVISGNNDIRILTDGEEKFTTLIREMEKAKEYIHLQYYIIREDEVWDRIRETMIKKAQEGVQVRLLFDGMGSRKLSKVHLRELERAGVKVAIFFPAFFGALHLRMNYRNHRKLVVIDGRIGFIGGFNIGREYIGKSEKFGYWRDTHLCIEGSSVTSLEVRFILDWNYAAKENLLLEKRIFKLPNFKRNGKELVQIVSSGPDSGRQQIRANYMRIIHKARKRIYIQTPYFIPDEAILGALMMAVQSGIEVVIMIPGKPDHPFVYWATYSYIGELVEAGAKCYVYNKGFLHGKVVTADGLITSCGTANMDIRSFKLNFEINAVIYSEKVAKEMEEIIKKDIADATLITKELYRQRKTYVKAKEQFSRLLSPLL